MTETGREHGHDREADPKKAAPEAPGRSAFVLTASDRGAGGEREDTSGADVSRRLEQLGFRVERMVVPDEKGRISRALAAAAVRHPLVVTTGGTGLTPRDVTPQATKAIVDYEVPGMAEAMRAAAHPDDATGQVREGSLRPPGRALIVNLPGSPKGALESLEALVPLLDHALETLAGPHDHGASPQPKRTTSS